MPNRTCSMSGCGKAHRARGLCATHYNQAYQPGRHRKVAVLCAQCGETVAKHQATRYANRFCSLLCRDVHRNGGAPLLSHLPRTHPVTRLLAGLPAQLPTPQVRPKPAVRVVVCRWCGASFSTTKVTHELCSARCKKKESRVRRRGAAKGWASHYTWAEVMRIHLQLGKLCAYCHSPIEGQPDPDHVVPLSRGGSDSITNILPCCSPCNSDKRELLLDEWLVDRRRRGLDPRTVDDSRWVHLTSTRHAA